MLVSDTDIRYLNVCKSGSLNRYCSCSACVCWIGAGIKHATRSYTCCVRYANQVLGLNSLPHEAKDRFLILRLNAVIGVFR